MRTIVLFDYLSRYLCSNIAFLYLHILKALLFKFYHNQNILFFNNFKSKGFIPFKNNKNFIFSNVFFLLIYIFLDFFFFLLALKLLFILSFFIQIFTFFFCLKCFIQKKYIDIHTIQSFVFLDSYIFWQFKTGEQLKFFFFKQSTKNPIWIFSQLFTLVNLFFIIPSYISLLLIFLINDIIYHQKINYNSLFIKIIFFISITKFFGFSLIIFKLIIDFLEYFIKNFNKIPNLFFLSKFLNIFLGLITHFKKTVGKLTIVFI